MGGEDDHVHLNQLSSEGRRIPLGALAQGRVQQNASTAETRLGSTLFGKACSGRRPNLPLVAVVLLATS